mgnify:CR=1 FL=1
MQGIARRLLDGFQVERARRALRGDDHSQQPPYFLDDFLLDRRGRFFSCGVSVCSTGRR